MNSIISKNRSWRIELCANVCDDVQPDCGEDEKHLPHSAEIDVDKTSTYDNFCDSESI